MALRKKIYAVCIAIIVLVILLAGFFVDLSTCQESKVNDVSGNIFFTNSTATYKIENVQTSWSYENPDKLQFNFNVYEEPSKIIYSLDDQANVSATGNFTLTELTDGTHYLTLYVTDKSGNTAYQTYHLSMPDQTPFYESAFYLPPIFALFGVLAFLIIYQKRSKKKIEVASK
jgi:hypothetical protein